MFECMLRTTRIERTNPYVPIIVDIEASGFGSRSYPIEIGVAFPNGDRYCSLISPDPTWLHWDPRAEDLHGLSRERLITHGETPETVCQRLNVLLKGKTLYTDGWTVDYPWIRTLYQAGREEISFTVSALEMILTEEDLGNWDHTKAKILRESGTKRHRASLDARLIQQTFVELKSRKQSTQAPRSGA